DIAIAAQNEADVVRIIEQLHNLSIQSPSQSKSLLIKHRERNQQWVLRISKGRGSASLTNFRSAASRRWRTDGPSLHTAKLTAATTIVYAPQQPMWLH